MVKTLADGLPGSASGRCCGEAELIIDTESIWATLPNHRVGFVASMVNSRLSSIISGAFRAHTGHTSTVKTTVLTVPHGKSSYQAAETEEK